MLGRRRDWACLPLGEMETKTASSPGTNDCASAELPVSRLPGLKWSESDAFGFLSSEQYPQAEWAVHIHIQESWVLGNLEWCKLRGSTINSCLD